MPASGASQTSALGGGILFAATLSCYQNIDGLHSSLTMVTRVPHGKKVLLLPRKHKATVWRTGGYDAQPVGN